MVRRWHEAVLLPIDQLILTISQDIFTEPSRLALSYKIALLLERAAKTHPDYSLLQFIAELDLIVKNERRLLGFSEEDTGFDPDQYKGRVVVATIHKAKGLEWDRVYLLSANNYDFPSAQEYDQYIGEKYFVRDQLNLEAEALAALKGVLAGDPTALYLREGTATIRPHRLLRRTAAPVLRWPDPRPPLAHHHLEHRPVERAWARKPGRAALRPPGIVLEGGQ